MWCPEFQPQIDALKSSGKVEYHALGVNLHHDGRIPQKRREKLQDLAVNDAAISADDAFETVSTYYQNHVKRSGVPDFQASFDDSNVAIDFTAKNNEGRSRVNHFAASELTLVRVVDLKHREVFQRIESAAWSRDSSESAIAMFEPLAEPYKSDQYQLLTSFPSSQSQLESNPDRADPDWRCSLYEEWLDDRLFAQGKEIGAYNARLLQYTLCQMSQPKTSRFDCMWVVPENLAPAKPDCAISWCQWTGRVPHDGQFLVLLSYPASSVEVLYRPCQLDAGTNPIHFPSPQDSPVHAGGYSVDVTATRTCLVSEYVHENRVIPFEHLEVRAITKAGRNTRDTNQPLRKVRHHHYEQLKHSLGPLGEWIPEIEVPIT